MSERGRGVLVVILAALLLGTVAAGPPVRLVLGPPHAEAPCPVAVEREGEGVSCLTLDDAERLGVSTGDRIAADGGVARMAAERIELYAAPVDVNAASLEELASLPGVGPGVAARIAAGRPYASVDALRRVAGIGARRFAVMLPRLRIGGSR